MYAVDAFLIDCPKDINAVGVLAVILLELNLMVHHNTDETFRLLQPSLGKNNVLLYCVFCFAYIVKNLQ